MKKIFIIFLIFACFIIGFYIWWKNGIAPADSTNTVNENFIIMKGEGARAIVDDLKKSGLVRDPIVFFLLLKKTGIDGKIQAGQFLLNPSMSAEEILQKLQVGKFDVNVTIPEGKRAQEIADIFQEKMPGYDETWRDKLDQNEGYLFPDTYLFPRNAGIEEIITVMKNNFDKKYTQVVNNTVLSKNEIVIIASLIEREAKHSEDRPLVSSVIHNRLNLGMKLDIDATVQYALGFDQTGKTWWKKELTHEDLKIDSPYNIYRNPGLPPGPICNPGIASIIAAAKPMQTDFLYYISDKEGNNHYASTLTGHNENVRKYRDSN
ncbi:endolytic transglycosylase MltG [Patescibacteria group bacterium]|nr:endolytic transglycosylase MltG [Patescibacteria group bacterium]MBU4098681.1 endolytic transglycosylase MltG [Patescibacteria group bacterium]